MLKTKRNWKDVIYSVVNYESHIIVVCSNSDVLQCFNTTFLQHFILNGISKNNSDLFEFCYAIALITAIANI